MKSLLFSCLAIGVGSSAAGFERVQWQAASVELPGGVVLDNAQATLTLLAGDRSALVANAATLRTGHRDWVLRNVRLRCGNLTIREPHFVCGEGRLETLRSPLGALRAAASIDIRSDRGSVAVNIGRLALADGTISATASLRQSRWQFTAEGVGLKLTSLLAVLRPWWQPPPGIAVEGETGVRLHAEGRARQVSALQAHARLENLLVQNESGTVASEQLRAEIEGSASGTIEDLAFQLSLRGLGGQALAGPVLIDLTQQPLLLRAAGRLTPAQVDLPTITISQSGLVQASGSATLTKNPAWIIDSAQLQIASLQFPAAYTSLLQLALAATEFGALATRGSASGVVRVTRNRMSALDLRLDELQFRDAGRKLGMDGIGGEIHWRAASMDRPAASTLRWQTLQAYGLDGGAAELQFRAHGSRLDLESPARIPLFDGALLVQRFNANDLGTSNVQLGFDATIEPISVQRLSRTFGWPEMSGQLAGRIPGLEFQRGTLRFAGDLTAQIFDGRITASDLQLRNAFGNFPRLSGDFIARGLDLEQITRTFPIGSITGRLDADIRDLELFGWTPIAFDASLYTTPGDRSRHRISQKAVGSLARVGGGGGGVVAALQSGFLQFFDNFGYDRLGLRCKLQNDVCEMGGIGPAGNGYYIVKGGGLPRIDVIGNSNRVAWARLLSQIRSALETQDIVVK